MKRQGMSWVLALGIVLSARMGFAQQPTGLPIRLGLVGFDSPQSLELVERLNASDSADSLNRGCRVVVAKAIPSREQDPERRAFAQRAVARLEQLGVEIVDSMDEIDRRSAGVMFAPGDYKNRRSDVEAALKLRKPVFLSQPSGLSTAEALHIFQVAELAQTPCFAATAARFDPQLLNLKETQELGAISRFEAVVPTGGSSGGNLAETAVAGAETLQTLGGSGIETVALRSDQGTDEVVAEWANHQTGVIRLATKPGTKLSAGAKGEKGQTSTSALGGEDHLLDEIGRFFQARQSPISPEQTVEACALLEGAEESRRLLGAPVRLESILARAKIEASLWR